MIPLCRPKSRVDKIDTQNSIKSIKKKKNEHESI